MSLKLRKAGEALLSKYDLDAYHVAVTSYKKLCLMTDCGQRFVEIPGVQFARLDPKDDEMEIALELLERWIARNKTKINAFHQALEVYQKIPELDLSKFPELEIRKGRTNGFEIVWEDWEYLLDIETCDLKSIRYVGEGKSGLSATKTPRLPATQLKRCRDLLSKQQRRQEARDQLESLAQALNTCSRLY